MATSLDEPRSGQLLSEQDWGSVGDTTTFLRRDTLSESRRWESRIPSRDVITVQTHGNPPRWVQSVAQSLCELLELPDDWDTYGSPPINPRAAYAAMKFALANIEGDAPPPSVVPTSQGGVQLEWHTRGVDLEIEFLGATRIHAFCEDERTGSSWEGDVTFDLSPLTHAITRISGRL